MAKAKVSDSEIIVFDNKDKKGWYERWYKGRNLLNFPHPYRCVLSANPGSGKTNLIKNIIVRAKPIFRKIYLCHFDDMTQEYDDIDAVKLDKLPDSRSTLFKGTVKSLLIIDDYDFKSLSKPQMNSFKSLFRYGSTHRGLSILVATQDFFQLPVVIRRLSNIYFIWKGSSDLDSLWAIGRRVGYSKQAFEELMNLCRDRFDNICIDMTVGSPAPVRFNSYTLIKSGVDVLEDKAKRKVKNKVKTLEEAEEEEEL